MDRIRSLCRTNIAVFARLLLPHVVSADWSALHHWLLRRRAEKTRLPLDARESTLDVVLAPRGAAKSSLVSLVFPLHALLHRHEAYIVLISATQRQASQRLAALRAELLENPLLRRLYPEALQRVTRRSATTLEANGVRIDAFGAGAELRGISHNARRPTWIILDDVERGDSTHSTLAREKLAAWFEQVVMNLGGPGTHIDLVGTLLHPDALPARLAARPDVVFRRFGSILRESPAAALWQAWRALYNDLNDPCRAQTARAFFLAHRAAMLAGTRVLWPARESYYALAVLREKLGPAVFDREKQNLPAPSEGTLFEPRRLRRFDLAADALLPDAPVYGPGTLAPEPDAAQPPRVPLESLRIVGFLDPALGGEAGDYAAVATLGVDPAGYAYLLDMQLRRARPSEQVALVFDLHARWRYEAFGVELNAFQSLLLEPFEAERARRRAAGEPWDLPLVERRHHGEKATRIAALEPLVHNQWLLFNRDLPRPFLDQLEQFPHAPHDDGPDALAAALTLARSAPALPLHPSATPRPGRRAIRNY